jgi:hypothetical protein
MAQDWLIEFEVGSQGATKPNTANFVVAKIGGRQKNVRYYFLSPDPLRFMPQFYASNKNTKSIAFVNKILIWIA